MPYTLDFQGTLVLLTKPSQRLSCHHLLPHHIISQTQILLELPDVKREVILLRLVEGLTFKEIAERIGVQEGAAKVRFYRAIAFCKEHLVNISGEDVTNLSITDRAKRGLTLAWQEPTRFEGISVKQYLELSGKTKDIIQIRNALNAVGLLPSLYLSRKVDKSLSGGERKRIELASVFLLKPKIAILDEIDSGVDYIAIEQVLATVKSISSEGSVLLITHQEEFLKIADVATLICNGIVLRTGNPNEISKYYKYECAFCDDEERRKNPLEEFLNVTG